MNNLVKWERYSPVGIGLEDMFRRLDAFADNESTNYPPYNIVKLDDDSQQLQIALAGWSRDEIEVSVERRVLNVKTIAPKLDESEFIHKGIATRTFSRNWQLSEDTVVGDVKYVDGLLSITLTKEVPEELKRRVLPIAE
jgi:molecular chaperone IbpA